MTLIANFKKDINSDLKIKILEILGFKFFRNLNDSTLII